MRNLASCKDGIQNRRDPWVIAGKMGPGIIPDIDYESDRGYQTRYGS